MFGVVLCGYPSLGYVSVPKYLTGCVACAAVHFAVPFVATLQQVIMIARRQRAGFLAATAAVTRRHLPPTAVLRCAPPRRSCYSAKPPCVTSDNDHDLQQLEEEYAKLKVNWFPGHMVKATKVIKEKLKQASEASGVVS